MNKVAKTTQQSQLEAQEIQPVVIQDEAERLIAMAIDKKVDVESLARLLEMRKDLRAEKAKEAFDRAMASFQAECPTIERTKQGYNYKYAPFEVIVEQVKPYLSQHGFSYMFDTEEATNAVIVLCHIKHTGGHSETSRATVDKETTTKMNASQQIGSVMTYGKRYAFVNGFGLVLRNEDNDAQSVSEPTKANQKPMTPREMADAKEEQSAPSDTLTCTDCDDAISPKVASYSQREFGRQLCFDCQKQARQAQQS